MKSFQTVDYSQNEIDEMLEGRFTRYYERFVTSTGPMGNAAVVIGEFDTPMSTLP